MYKGIFSKKTSKIIFFAFIIFVATSLFAVVIFGAKHAGAGEEHTVSGYAWSDNIGWISFNCTDSGSCAESNYGVSVSAETGVMEGFAWSDNIGWISFNENDLGGCPQEPCVASLDDGILSGFARALSNGGGWDGFMSLGGVSPDYSVVLQDDGDLDGYAWGSDVVGWMLFNLPFGFGGVRVDFPPDVSLTECQDTLDNEGDGRIDSEDPGCWSNPLDETTYDPFDDNESDEPQCMDTFDNDNDGKTDENDPGCLTNPNFPDTYNPIDDDEFNVLQPNLSVEPSTIVKGESTTISWECFDSTSSQGVNYSTDNNVFGTAIDFPSITTTYSLVCSNGGESSVEVIVLNPEVTINASPSLIKPNDSSTIGWSAVNVVSCEVQGPSGVFWAGISGSESTGPLVDKSTYIITCTTMSAETIGDSATVNILPEFGEQ